MFDKAKIWARRVKTDLVALHIAMKDGRTPLAAKLMAVFVVTYALSPIDLIPDFIPVLGYLDDLVIVPLGMVIAIRLIPTELFSEFRALAAECGTLPASRTGALFVIGVWILAATAFGWWLLSRYSR